MRTSVLTLALLLTSAFASAAEQTRPMPAFDAVSTQGAINMVVEVGQTQSLVLRGEEKIISAIETKVVDGKLIITFPKNKKNSLNVSSETKILIGMPALRAFHVEGAGSAELKNVAGDSIDIGFQGAGRLVASGKVKYMKLTAQGVGDVDTKALLTQRADVSFEGIGAVKVHASDRLDAVVQGMGSLNYFGNPKVINKTVEGIGSVKAGG
ncbi:MAG: head GIN domain-containing protein [Pseudomonadota bacterium]